MITPDIIKTGKTMAIMEIAKQAYKRK